MTATQPIDKKFLENILKESVTDFKVGAGCEAGDNVAGSLKSISAKTSSGKQAHFVLKQFPENMTQENSFVVFMKAFWRENSVYKTILPKMEEFAREHGLDYIAPVPKYYKGHNDDKNDYILLQDVRPDGYKMPSKLTSLTFEETSLTLKEFARFHAIGYALLRHEGNKIFKEIDGFQYLLQDPTMKAIIEVQFAEVIKLFYNVAASLLENRFPEGAQKMRKYSETSGKLYNTMEHLTDTVVFPTLCHFDLWSNNMLLKYNEQGKPEGVKLIDFQFMQRGNIFSDLHYTLYTSTTPEFRKQHLYTVLNLYYDEFCSTLETMNIPLPWGFTRAFFIDKFEAGIGSAFVRMTFAIPLQLGTITQTQKDEEDNEKVETLHTEKGVRKMYEESPAAMERLEGLVKEMIERKIFK